MIKLFETKGDITTLEVDAIVNSQGAFFSADGKLSKSIHEKAGPELDVYCKTLGALKTGEAKISPAFNLPAKYIIHTLAPIFINGLKDEDVMLQNCYLNSLKIASEYNLQSIAFPAIATGYYRYPKEFARPIALLAIKKFFNTYPNSSINTIYLVEY